MIVGGLQGADIASAHFSSVLQIGASPRKPFTAEPHNQKIGHEACVAAVAVRKAMNQHPVMEAHRDLVGRICPLLDPRLRVVEQLPQRDGSFIEGNPEIAFARPEVTRPPPYIAEHPPVQVLHEFLAQRITAAVEPRVKRGSAETLDRQAVSGPPTLFFVR